MPGLWAAEKQTGLLSLQGCYLLLFLLFFSSFVVFPSSFKVAELSDDGSGALALSRCCCAKIAEVQWRDRCRLPVRSSPPLVAAFARAREFRYNGAEKALAVIVVGCDLLHWPALLPSRAVAG